MSKRTMISIAAFAVLIGFSAMAAKAQDVRDCQDHPLFTRMPDFTIGRCKLSDFDFFEFDASRDGRLEKVRVEGRKTVINYDLKSGAAKPGALQIIQNYANAVKAIGGTVLRQQTGVATLMVSKGGT